MITVFVAIEIPGRRRDNALVSGRTQVHPTSQQRKPAEYAVKWLAKEESPDIRSKTGPVVGDEFKNETSNGSDLGPADQFKNGTKRKTGKKDTHKQQAVADCDDAVQILADAGFDLPTARQLSQSRELEENKA